jgi:hypothetical protein
VAEDLAPVEVGDAPAQQTLVTRRPPETPSVFRGRFALAYLALAVLAGAALGATMLVLDRPAEETSAPWSAWKPTGNESSFPRQIADYVDDRYTMPSGDPMVAIISGPPQVQDVPVRNIAIRNDPQGDQDDISIVGIDPDQSVMYAMCGLGPQCSIAEGDPTEERGQLLRREALELALYTFKYADVDAVIALLPPRLAQSEEEETTSTALFFQRKDFSRELNDPLRRTLLATDQPQAAEIASIERPTIERLTRSRLYVYAATQAQEGSAILVLTPIQ